MLHWSIRYLLLRLLEELSLAEKRYGDLLKMYLSDRREQSRLLAEQLGVPLPPVLKPEESKAEGDNVAESTENIGSAENTCSKRRCVEVRGEELESPAGTMGSQSSAETVTGEVRERESEGIERVLSALL